MALKPMPVYAYETVESQPSETLQFGYIYLIREREFLQANQNVYKVGHTVQRGASLQLRRLQDYKKGSELCFVRQVIHTMARDVETEIKKEFKASFTKHFDGHEFFYGSMEDMIDIINKHCVAIRQSQLIPVVHDIQDNNSWHENDVRFFLKDYINVNTTKDVEFQELFLAYKLFYTNSTRVMTKKDFYRTLQKHFCIHTALVNRREIVKFQPDVI